MLCLKCKNEIDEKTIRCTYCGTKVQSVCPVCKTINPIGAEFCSGCGLQLIKYCPNCDKANLPSAKNCRKCGFEFEENVAGLVTKCNDDIEVVKRETPAVLEEEQVSATPTPALTAEEESFTQETENEPENIENEAVFVEEIPEFENTPEPEAESEPESEVSEENTAENDTAENLEELADEPAEQEQKTEEPEPEQVDIKLENYPGAPLSEENEGEEEQVFEQEDCNQDRCKNTIVKAIESKEKLVIGLSADEGMGKSTVLKYVFNDLLSKNYNWMWGECSANSQISPFGIFQEMFLTFFNCPNFTTMSPDFVGTIKEALRNFFTSFNSEEIDGIFNFLYPTRHAKFEEILKNKQNTFKLLEKTILEISQKSKLIISIDDFDMIDGASYEFLVYFIENGGLSENLKLIIAYKDKRIAQGYFYSEKIAENQYQDVRLGRLTKDYADNLIKIYLNGTNPLPDEVFAQIYKNSKGNSAYIEQILVLLNENDAFYQENGEAKYRTTPIELEMPKNIYDIITKRLEHLEKNFPMVFKTLCTAAIMGNKFNIGLLELVMKINSEDFKNILTLLANSAYISQFNNNMFIFKNTLLWRIIYEKAKQSEDFGMLNEKIFDAINPLILSSNALKALIVQNLNQKLLALGIWTENIKLCAYLGDEHLWVLSQKQSLKIVEEVTPQKGELIINNIYERMGKLLYSTKPAEAIEYISFALNSAIKISNVPKTIELSGYLSKSCSIVGNYHGVIEAIDTILKLIEKPEYRLECAILKYKKLKAMFSIGNSEEIYNLASNEIIPVIEQAISQLIPCKNIPMDIIYETWLETNLIVANALSIQGNNKCFQILSLIDEIIAKNNVDNKNYLNRVALAKALAYSIQGDVEKSAGLLIEVNQNTAREIVEPEIISQWNFINILNKLVAKDFDNIKEDMYSVVTFANNYNDVLVKNLLKIFLGKVLQEEGSLAKALEIYNEQVAVFAREKIAIGALLCWYFIAKITLVTDGSDKALDIAQKALEVAKNPKINNYYFMVLYKRLIAEIFLIKGDLEAAKMYIEKALMIVKSYDMKLQKVLLYQLYAKYLEEMVTKKPKNKITYAENAMNTFKKSLKLIKALNIPAIDKDIEQNQASFRAFCALNGIQL